MDIFLNPERAKELEQRVIDRLSKPDEANGYLQEVRKAAVRSVVLAFQEYERMKIENQNS